MSSKKSKGRRGPAYPVRLGWQEDVRQRLRKLGMTEKELARKIGCAQSTIHDTLNNPDASHSSLVPAIHSAIGWDPPPDPQQSPPLPSPDAIELAHMFDRLPEKIRRQLRDQALTYIELLGKPDSDKN